MQPCALDIDFVEASEFSGFEESKNTEIGLIEVEFFEPDHGKFLSNTFAL